MNAFEGDSLGVLLTKCRKFREHRTISEEPDV